MLTDSNIHLYVKYVCVSALRWCNVIVHAVIKIDSLDMCFAQLGYHMLGFHFQLISIQLYCTVEIDLYDQHELRFDGPFMTKHVA